MPHIHHTSHRTHSARRSRNAATEGHSQRRAVITGGSGCILEADAQAEDRGQSRPHRSPRAAAAGKNAAAACVLFASLGLGCALAAEINVYVESARPDPRLILLASIFTSAALGLGIAALISQLHTWSRRVRKRLLIGLPLTLFSLLVIAANRFIPHDPNRLPHADITAVSSARPAPATGDGALIKSGWYGELQQDGLLLVITSFPDSSEETRRFNRRTRRPVSYATLSVINLGCPVPAVMKTLEATLRLDSGETVQSLAVKPLLAQDTQANADLLKRLALPQKIPIGTMLPDIPLCQEPGFSWKRVSAVMVTLGPRTFGVPGRLMTAEEKAALIDYTAKRHRSNSATNRSAEAWFKDF
ncbi:MAG: hypothetical protein PHV28_00290 [Kiritimatiellae bacterium]|nr:hypothetical protein [Kiritimatiellia bacterium]